MKHLQEKSWGCFFFVISEQNLISITMNIIISPAGRGRFHARLGDRLLCTSATPFFSAARILKAEGVLWQEPLTMTHEGSGTICLTSTVGEAANFTVEEGDRGTRYRPYRPGPTARPE